jgi:hypothetical protein
MSINWLGTIAYLAQKLPIEKMFSRPPDESKSRQELKEILMPSNQAIVNKETAPVGRKVEVKANPNTTSSVTTEETVNYQNRELGKILIQMERHAAQGFKINGKSCDCGIKHLPDIESLAEETIPMVSNPDIYLELMNWVREIGPKITPEANDSGKYLNEYPKYAHQARDFRKKLLGTLDYTALFGGRDQEGISTDIFDQKENNRKQKEEGLEIPPDLAREPLPEPNSNMPKTEPVTKNIPGIGGVDAGIADNIEALNNAGYKTAQSHSGFSADHPGRKYEQGYIAFFKSNLDPEKISAIKTAAETSGLVWEEDEVFFQPSITIRTDKLKNGKSSFDYLKESNIESGLNKAHHEDNANEYMNILRKREEIIQRKIAEAGGYLQTSDQEAKAAFDEFTRQLTTKPIENIPENIPEEPEEKTTIYENGTVCKNLMPMAEWVKIEEEDPNKCHECMIPIVVAWYFEELEERGEKELLDDLEVVQKKGNPIETAAALDQVKEQADPELRQRLLEFDCATQTFDGAESS